MKLRPSFLRWDSRIQVMTHVSYKNGITVLIGLYVDDDLLTGDNQEFMDQIMINLKKSFKITHTKNVRKFLGLEISVTRNSVQLHQEQYIMEVAKRFGMENCKKTIIPMSPHHSLVPVKGSHNPTLKYQELIGALLLISRCTRPDVAFSVNKLSRYLKCYILLFLGVILCSLMDKTCQHRAILCCKK